MDIRFINPFITSVKHVFQTMLGTDVTVGKPFVVQPNNEPSSDVSAVIGLSGDAQGCVVLGFPITTAVEVASKFSGVEMTPDHEDFSDALGELANIVAGQAKAKFEGLKVSISLPSVVIGEQHVVSQSRQAPRLSLPCESELGQFYVEVVIVVDQHSTSTRAPAAAGAVS